jgi:putative FmdB family regulatory protein
MFPTLQEEPEMPVYEYRCGKCGNEFEELQRITDGPIRKCPKCGKLAVERLISRSSFVLKGSGWYATDYGRKSSPDASTTSGDGKSNGGKTSTEGADKPAPASSSSSDKSSSDKSTSSDKSSSDKSTSSDKSSSDKSTSSDKSAAKPSTSTAGA